MPEHKKERGQVLVLMVVAMVALLGFTALAIDGGMVYSERRNDQNAADTASLAAAGAAGRALENNHIYYETFKCDATVNPAKSAALTAGQTSASSNLFTLDTDLTDNHGVEVTCHIVDLGAYKDKYLEIKTMITTETETAFAHLLFGGDLKSTVTSVATVRPRATETFGYAIVSTSSECDQHSGIEFDGSGLITVRGAGIFSNSCLTRNGDAHFTLEETDEDIMYRDSYDPHGHSGYVGPEEPVHASASLPPINIPTPSCAGLDDQGDHLGGGSISPGIYDRIRVTNNEDLVLSPGLYCIDGGVIATGGTITGHDVTLYLRGGDFDIAGGVRVTLDSPQLEPAPNGAIKGLLIYLADGNTGEVALRGSSDSSYLGTVYAPDGQIDVGGNGSSIEEISCNLIGHGVKLHGNITLDIRFSTPQNWSQPSVISQEH
ncbi:MAG TPA: pilus assembly protein TadG-related protein [Anaerolineaceae bacterium]|nr:pilus assembly protein TadG-related protein [Anaerolineaceae bacterium]